MVFEFVCCPFCGEVTQLERIGIVGLASEVPGKDSDKIKCFSCGSVFRSKGETIWEAVGRNK